MKKFPDWEADLKYPHQPVLVDETIQYLIHSPNGIYVDGTVGNAGHSQRILERLSEDGRLICLDRDPDAIRLSRKRLAHQKKNVEMVQANFSDLGSVLHQKNIQHIHGVLLDLGMSSGQLEDSGRGFSFNREEPLDMRMDPDSELTAYQLVNEYSPKDLEAILRDYGQEKRARQIVKAIVAEREKRPIQNSAHLSDLIRLAYPPSQRFGPRHPATKTFQAIRIAVNTELKNLEVFLDSIPTLLTPGGRLVVLSYHSLEDRRVKQAMVKWEKACTCPPDFPHCVCNKIALFRRLTRKGVKPGVEETATNPRARSAVLRAAERI